MEKCSLCNSKKKDNIRYGEFITKDGVSAHTFCLYLSSNLEQIGTEKMGILGFLLKHIRAERERVSKLICCYCHKPYANIGCCERKCRRCFHLICGQENGALNQFVNTYMSFCNKHAYDPKERPSENEMCFICLENLRNENEKFSATNMLQAPCCRNGWFHKWCLQQLAQTAGYFFSCPLCKDNTTFRKELSCKGIFIPDKDADWELEQNAFVEQLERPKKCTATTCKNKYGRWKSYSYNPLMICSTCGSLAIHKNCLPQHQRETFNCDDCLQMLSTYRNQGSSTNSAADHLQGNEIDIEDAYVDVCSVESTLEETDSDEENIFRRKRKRCSNPISDYDDEDDLNKKNNLQELSQDGELSNENNGVPSSKQEKMDENTIEKYIESSKKQIQSSDICFDGDTPQNIQNSSELNNNNDEFKTDNYNTLNESFIANRTRRKSCLLSTVQKSNTDHFQHINNLPIASRTRRKSIVNSNFDNQNEEDALASSSSSSTSSSQSPINQRRSIKRIRRISSDHSEDECSPSVSFSSSLNLQDSVKRVAGNSTGSNQTTDINSNQTSLNVQDGNPIGHNQTIDINSNSRDTLFKRILCQLLFANANKNCTESCSCVYKISSVKHNESNDLSLKIRKVVTSEEEDTNGEGNDIRKVTSEHCNNCISDDGEKYCVNQDNSVSSFLNISEPETLEKQEQTQKSFEKDVDSMKAEDMELTTNKHNALNGSFIANRTRRKSVPFLLPKIKENNISTSINSKKQNDLNTNDFSINVHNLVVSEEGDTNIELKEIQKLKRKRGYNRIFDDDDKEFVNENNSANISETETFEKQKRSEECCADEADHPMQEDAEEFITDKHNVFNESFVANRTRRKSGLLFLTEPKETNISPMVNRTKRKSIVNYNFGNQNEEDASSSSSSASLRHSLINRRCSIKRKRCISTDDSQEECSPSMSFSSPLPLQNSTGPIQIADINSNEAVRICFNRFAAKLANQSNLRKIS